MDSYQIGSLVYLALLGGAVGGYFLIAHRPRVGEILRHALLWALIFLGVIAAAGLWSDIRDDVAPRQSFFSQGSRVEVPRAYDGHYYLRLEVNGESVLFVVDTGATDIVLTRQDATRAGILLDQLIYTGRANTANGLVRTAHVRIDELSLGPIRDRNVPVSVNAGEMETSLLGMEYLHRFDRLEIAGGRLVLER